MSFTDDPDLAKAVDRLVGGRIRVRRKLKRLTEAGLAAAAGVSSRALLAWERGDDRIDAATLEAIACLLEVPVSYFFETFDPQEDVEERLAAAVGRSLAADEGQALADRFPTLAATIRQRLVALAQDLAAQADGPPGPPRQARRRFDD